jgi:stage II sporulation protein AA (anti-sigma F factor antagonist)
MSIPKTFSTESEGETLIVVPLVNVSSLAEEDVRPELDRLLDRLREPGLKNVIIDFAKVSYFGTTMLEAMHAIWKRARESAGKMVLCNLSNMEREVLRVAGFDVLWPICSSREEAFQALRE